MDTYVNDYKQNIKKLEIFGRMICQDFVDSGVVSLSSKFYRICDRDIDGWLSADTDITRMLIGSYSVGGSTSTTYRAGAIQINSIAVLIRFWLMYRPEKLLDNMGNLNYRHILSVICTQQFDMMNELNLHKSVFLDNEVEELISILKTVYNVSNKGLIEIQGRKVSIYSVYELIRETVHILNRCMTHVRAMGKVDSSIRKVELVYKYIQS